MKLASFGLMSLRKCQTIASRLPHSSDRLRNVWRKIKTSGNDTRKQSTFGKLIIELEKTRKKQQWYLPHHTVINPNKPEKVRRVWNAKLKFSGVSLNDMLSVPDLVQNLIGIIFRLREHSIAMTVDVEAMFLQVLVPSDDCRFLRFFWRDNISDPIQV